MDCLDQDIELAARNHPDAIILPVTASPSRKHNRERSVGVLAAWRQNGKIRKRTYHRGREYAIRPFMQDVLGNFTNGWERHMHTLDAETLEPQDILASEVIKNSLGQDPVHRQHPRSALAAP